MEVTGDVLNRSGLLGCTMVGIVLAAWKDELESEYEHYYKTAVAHPYNPVVETDFGEFLSVDEEKQLQDLCNVIMMFLPILSMKDIVLTLNIQFCLLLMSLLYVASNAWLRNGNLKLKK